MKLFSREYGSGDPLLILHGLFGMSDNWNTLGKRWSERMGVNVHLLDMRNHGRSPWSAPHTYDAMSDDIHAYLEEKGLHKVQLLGHSMGGKAAMCFTALNPDKVEKLMVADIAPRHYPVQHREIIDALLHVKSRAPESRKEAQDLLSEKIPNKGIQFFLLKSLHRTEAGVYDWRFNVDLINSQIEEVGKALPDRAFYDGPTCFIRGGKSDYITDDDLDRIHDHFPSGQLETIGSAGHWLHAEQPEIFSEIVEKFMRK
ncbi:MAG: alpha/beta fold hydrolase [Cryomorphaceae bacterium]|nr:alpha/beta fold hydrolase [Cryomorphaceae bacterium]